MAENTHLTTTPNKKPSTPLETFRASLAGEMRQITNYFEGSKAEAMKFASSAVEYIRQEPKLLACDRTSLIMALVQVAQYRFMPSGTSGEAFIIPYKNEASFQLGYQGLVTLLYRTEKISTISSSIVHANDTFEYEEGLEPRLVHKPAMFGKERGDAIGVYTVAVMKDGTRTFKVMDKAAVMRIKDLSKAKGSQASPWNSNDPELWMWRKTCLIQHAKLLPKTAELQKALASDYEGGGLEKPKLDAGGPAVPKSDHRVIDVADNAPAQPETKKVEKPEDPDDVRYEAYVAENGEQPQ